MLSCTPRPRIDLATGINPRACPQLAMPFEVQCFGIVTERQRPAALRDRNDGRMIYVTPLSKLDETLALSGAQRLVTLLRKDSTFARPAGVLRENHLILQMHDITEKTPGMIAPSRRHVTDLLRFARNWDRSAPLAINCYAGISRSTAAAYIIAAALAPNRDETELARELRARAPSATPNIRLIALADALLGRESRMIEAVKSIGRGEEAFEGVPFALGI